ncbi:unnamed protein product [Arabis nemorensis]|uniref:Uncharacterized protein n=1 Tax=Arabis nemorensis TaxID=586526 RepID=A0A565BWS4_9BRAS|nr:unnamed protein product [Arabis nemorensis]
MAGQGDGSGCNQVEVTFGEFEEDSTSQWTRGGRPIKSTVKVQEMQWTTVGGRGNNGKRGRGRGPTR